MAGIDQPLSLKLSSLSLISQKKLEEILAVCGDKKDLIIDPTLIKPLEKICGVTWLRKQCTENKAVMESSFDCNKYKDMSASFSKGYQENTSGLPIYAELQNVLPATADMDHKNYSNNEGISLAIKVSQCSNVSVSAEITVERTTEAPLTLTLTFLRLLLIDRQHGVDKIYKMDPQLGNTPNINRIYLIPASTSKYKCVLDQINAMLLHYNMTGDMKKNFHIIIVPISLSIYKIMLESRGLYDVVSLHSFSWELMYLDEQLLSLELPFLFKELFVDHDKSLISGISRSIWSTLQVFGQPKVVFSLGKLSASVLDVIEVYNETYTRDFMSAESSNEIGALIIMDRDQDYASGLLTPSTYSGLLSEIFTIINGNLELDVEDTKLKKGRVNLDFSTENKEKKNTIMPLDSNIDSLYGEIKHRHFAEVSSVLSSKAKLLKNEDIKALGIQEMKDYVATKLQQVTLFKQNLVNHVMACETIVTEMSNKFEDLKLAETEMLNNRNKKSNYNFVDETFSTEIHIHNSLRLMCLLSLTQGLSYDEYHNLAYKYSLAFGYKYSYVFNNLISAGLLIKPSSPKLSDHLLPKWQNTFQSTANKLKQLPSQPEVDKSSPSYVFNGGYVPLISTLCNTILTAESLSEVITKLSVLNNLKIGGQSLEFLKTGMETLNEKLSNLDVNNDLEFGCKDVRGLQKVLKSDSNIGNMFPLKPKTVLVYVVGGVTFAEIAACNVVEMVTGSKIYIAGDNVICGGDLISACM